MAKPKRPGGPKQKLSPAAAKRKAARDLKIAKTPRRTAMKAETQRKRRAAKKNGVSVKGKDFDHNRNRFVSEKVNRSATKTTNNTMATGGKKKKTKSGKDPHKPKKILGKTLSKKKVTTKKPLSAKSKAAGRKFLSKKKKSGKDPHA